MKYEAAAGVGLWLLLRKRSLCEATCMTCDLSPRISEDSDQMPVNLSFLHSDNQWTETQRLNTPSFMIKSLLVPPTGCINHYIIHTNILLSLSGAKNVCPHGGGFIVCGAGSLSKF